VTVSNPAVVVEAVKLAEDRSGDLIVRLYESLGTRSTATVRPNFAATTVQRTDLLERPLNGAATSPPDSAGGLTLVLRPFELVTLRIRRSDS
jgi:alpha-mannosidase